MSQRLSESSIVRQLAEHVARRLTLRAIEDLQSMMEVLGSGDDSGLESVWEEICVQVQYEQSVMWEAYVETMEGLLFGLVEELPSHEQEALWLVTDTGEEWDCEDEDLREAYPVLHEDTVRYLLNEHLLPEAGRWSNQRISTYLERASAID
jgi:hypothetical protein